MAAHSHTHIYMHTRSLSLSLYHHKYTHIHIIFRLQMHRATPSKSINTYTPPLTAPTAAAAAAAVAALATTVAVVNRYLFLLLLLLLLLFSIRNQSISIEFCCFDATIFLLLRQRRCDTVAVFRFQDVLATIEKATPKRTSKTWRASHSESPPTWSPLFPG